MSIIHANHVIVYLKPSFMYKHQTNHFLVFSVLTSLKTVKTTTTKQDILQITVAHIKEIKCFLTGPFVQLGERYGTL